jgi:hypothetical protein
MVKKKAWREFEKLVARIERILGPGAVVMSPDRIIDRITGQEREVDASIRSPKGEVTTLECRDRWTIRKGKRKKQRQDVCWIEQLVTKKADLGISLTIGVSAGGFTKAAIRKAQHHGIELRRLSQITDAEIAQQWVSGFGIAIVVPDFNAIALSIFGQDGTPILPEEVEAGISAGLRADLNNTGFLRFRGDDRLISTLDLTQLRQPQFDLNSKEIRETPLVLESRGDDWSIDIVNGRRIVSRVVVMYQVRLVEFPAVVQSAARYDVEGGATLLDQIEAVANLGEATVNLTFSGQLEKPFPPISN